MTAADRRAAALAGHQGEATGATDALDHPDPAVRATAYAALDRRDALTDELLERALGDPAPTVRRRAAALAATRPGAPVAPLLDDPDPLVAEMAAWTLGEHEVVDPETVRRLITTATDHDDALVREAAIAALGAIGDPSALPAVLAGTRDKPAIRRRAVIALVAFEGPEVAEALETARTDRDWQVREAADEILREV